MMKDSICVCLAAASLKKGGGSIYIEERKLGFKANMKITIQYPQLATKFLLILSIKFILLHSQNQSLML